MTSKIGYLSLVDELLKAVPELSQSYEKLKMEYSTDLTKQDYQELDEIRKLHNIPYSDPNLPGITIVFESLLCRYIFEDLVSPLDRNRIQQIFKWIEFIVVRGDSNVLNLVGTSICEPILTTYERYFEDIYIFLGPQTILLCREYASDFKLRETTTEILRNI